MSEKELKIIEVYYKDRQRVKVLAAIKNKTNAQMFEEIIQVYNQQDLT